MKKHGLTFLIIFMITTGLLAQVKFKLDYDKAQNNYIVSIVPMTDLQHPDNLTATAQITVKTPAGKFNPKEIKGLYPGLEWEFNSKSDAPKEAPDHDYISFGLKNPGLLHLPFEKDQALPILSFKNEFGCTGPVQLVDNAKDPFMAPNSQRVNIGNTIAVLGYGIDAFGGVVDQGLVDCSGSTTNVEENGVISKHEIFPVPAGKELFLQFNWEGKRETVRAEIIDAGGRVVIFQKMDVVNGANQFAFDVSKLAGGAYLLKIKGDKWEQTLDKFQKIRA